MPSSIASGPKFRSVKGGRKFRVAPDFTVNVRFAAADLTGATSGFVIFTAPAECEVIDVTETHATAGTNTFRLKKIVAGATSAPGAAADADNVDITAAVSLASTANTPVTTAAITDGSAKLEEGDRLAVASTAGTATLAGATMTVRLAWL
jgi:hypothetical protein